ncbi:unnamed protein product [Rotaria socialis]
MFKLSLYLILLILFPCISCDLIELSDIIIREHTPIGHLLVKLNASTQQRHSYRFVNNNYRDIQQYFSLNSSTGELHIANDIDRELICTHRHSQCRFLLKIFELFHEKLYHIPIIIEDVNDHHPTFPYSSSEIELHISENSPPYQSKLFIQQAYDQDQIDNENRLKYKLKNFDENFPFMLEINDDLSNRLVLILTEGLDRETIDSYNCTLYVTDTGGHHAQLQVKIIIDDVNDQSPIFERDIYSIELSEHTSINTIILQVRAYDGDIGLNGQITYKFTDASKQYDNLFSINNETGFIRLRSLLDYEQRTSYVFYIEAHDSGKEIRSSQTLINITILDENDCYPIINFRFLPEMNSNQSDDLIEISENYSIDKFFVKVFITDQDSSHSGRMKLWFEILDSYNKHFQEFNIFQIDDLTYYLNCTKSFDYEYQQWYRLTFFAEDINLNKTLQTNRTLTIHILDENDNIPQFLQPFYHLSIYENNQADIILTKIETFDHDDGDNGRLTYEIVTNESSFPFSIDSTTGILRCTESFDREKRSEYKFEILVRDYGSPMSLSSKVSIKIDIKDVNDNKPVFEYDKYEFSIDENFPQLKSFGLIRAYDNDLNTNFIYYIEDEDKFIINQYGEIFLQSSIDREIQDKYQFIVTVSDNYFQTSVPVFIHLLDINDCQPQWTNPFKNHTKLFINRDVITIGTMIIKLKAVDQDDVTNGNGLVRYFMNENYSFLSLLNSGELILNSSPRVGHYLLNIAAEDSGKLIQYSSSIDIELFVGDNYTNTSQFYDRFYKINSLSTTKRVILLATFFLSIIFILTFTICIVSIMVCRYRKQKYLYYVQYNKNQVNNTKLATVHNHLTDSSSDSSKLSLEDVHGKHLIDHSSSPSITGANMYTHHHQIIKPTHATSDYYSNSSKHDEDTDELTDEQPPTFLNNAEWSIEKILYPDWLYNDALMDSKRHWNTSTFAHSNSFQALEKNESVRSRSTMEKRTISTNSSPSPKQVRFGSQRQLRTYPHLSTTVQQLRTRTATTTISDNDIHNSFI